MLQRSILSNYIAVLFAAILVISRISQSEQLVGAAKVNAFVAVPLRCRNRLILAQRRRRCASLVVVSLSKNGNNNDGNDNNDANSPRNSLAREIRGLQLTGLKETIQPGDTIVSKRELPLQGIYENKGYELQSIYAQAFQESTQKMETLPLENLDVDIPSGYDRYITLFNPAYHTEPVVVTPEEVGLVSIRKELVNTLWLAVPGFFWVFVAYKFYSIYHERTGGSFVDAFLGR